MGYSPNSPTNDIIVNSFGLVLPKTKQSHYYLACVSDGSKQTPRYLPETGYQLVSVKKDIPYAPQHTALEALLEDHHTSSPGLFHLWLAECMAT